MTILIIAIIIYILSVIGAYKYIQISHSKDGQWSNLEPGSMDIFIILFPFLNFILVIGFFVGNCYKDNDKRKFNTSSFFRVKK